MKAKSRKEGRSFKDCPVSVELYLIFLYIGFLVYDYKRIKVG